MVINTTLEEGLRRRMHRLVGEFADCTARYPDEARAQLKEHLISIGMIEKSTKELDIKGLAIAGNIVAGWIKDAI